jgi:hypothetical protein
VHASRFSYIRKRLALCSLPEPTREGFSTHQLRIGQPGYGLLADWILARAVVDALSDHPAEAVAGLETVLHLPRFYTREWLRLDPTWVTLRDRPDFKRLVFGP